MFCIAYNYYKQIHPTKKRDLLVDVEATSTKQDLRLFLC